LLEGADASWKEFAEQETLQMIDRAISLLDRASHAKASGSRIDRLRADLLFKRGMVHTVHDRLDAAFNDYRTAAELYERKGLAEGVIEVLHQEAITLRRQGRYDEAHDRAQDALNRAEQIGFRKG